MYGWIQRIGTEIGIKRLLALGNWIDLVRPNFLDGIANSCYSRPEIDVSPPIDVNCKLCWFVLLPTDSNSQTRFLFKARKRGSFLEMHERFALLDAMKGIAACIIVGHHLCEYSPSSDLADRFAPSLLYGLYNYGLFAVHLFLVFGGFGLAMAMPEQPTSFRQASFIFTKRYLRLFMPYSVMLTLLLFIYWSKICDGVNPPLIDSFSWMQLLAHALFLQDVLGYGNLSAGTWYLCIDIQYVLLFLLIQASLATAGKIANRNLSSETIVSSLLFPLGMMSIWYWSRIPGQDVFVFYFLGSLVLGSLVAWEWKGRIASWILFLYAFGMISSLVIEVRPRVLVAMGSALILYLVVRYGQKIRVLPPFLWLGKISYSLFLIHYLVNGVVLNELTPWIGDSPSRAFTAMIFAFLFSLLAGSALHFLIEAPCSRWLKSSTRNPPAESGRLKTRQADHPI